MSVAPAAAIAASALVYDPAARWPEATWLRPVAAGAAAGVPRVDDRAQALLTPAAAFADPAAVAAALAALGARLRGRNDGEAAALLVSDAPAAAAGLAAALDASAVVARRVALAFGEEARAAVAAAGAAAPAASLAAQAPDAIHIGLGVDVGLCRCEGRVVCDRQGQPVDPRGLVADFDAAALTASAAQLGAAEPSGRGRQPGAPRAEADGAAAARCQALARWIASLLHVFDVADVYVHLLAPAAAAGLGLPSDPVGDWPLGGDGAAAGALGRAVAAVAFASLRQGATLRVRVVDPDAAAVGAVLAVRQGFCWPR